MSALPPYKVSGSETTAEREAQRAADAEWEKIALEAMSGDRAFQRWRKVCLTSTWIAGVLVFAPLMWIAIGAYETSHARSGKILILPLVVALCVISGGYRIYYNKMRAIALPIWSKQREEKFKKRQKNA